MSHNPEHFRMTLNAVMVPDFQRSRADRVRLAKEMLADCMAASLVKMDKFIDGGETPHGDEQIKLEIFVFTRPELNEFMESVAETTAQYIARGMPKN